MINAGDPLPQATLDLADGTSVNLADFAGRPLVLYAYPRADTPGCTTEAQDFTARIDDFNAINTRVIGLSKDSVAKLGKFRDKYDLGVILASDPEGALIEALGSWVEKSMYGKTSMGIERSTFLFAADGTLKQVWRKVKVKGHADEVLAAARAL
jgi:thioredoxin-dependent peroxiredoxin